MESEIPANRLLERMKGIRDPRRREGRIYPLWSILVMLVLAAINGQKTLRSQIYIPEAIRRCEFFINAPKFKAHAMLGVTFALKNLMGIQQDAHRIIDHDYKLAYKVADLQEVISPGFIAVDAIIAGEYCELAPKPFSLGLIIMGVNPVAVDSVCTPLD